MNKIDVILGYKASIEVAERTKAKEYGYEFSIT